MKLNKMDLFVIIVAIILLFSLIGMLFDIWQLIYYAIPVLSVILLILGSFNYKKRKSTNVAVVLFSILMVLGFVWAGVGMTDLSQDFGGFSHGAGVFLYVVWPLLTISGGVYALMNRD